jgi:hypothetical protein
MNPTATPGKTAWERVSPKSDNFRVTTKPPMSPHPQPIKTIPDMTTFTDFSLNEKN